MIDNIVAIWGVNVFPFLIVLVFVAFWILVIIGLFRLVRYLGTAGKEHTLLRIELGKLSEEVHLLRQELKEPQENKDQPQADST